MIGWSGAERKGRTASTPDEMKHDAGARVEAQRSGVLSTVSLRGRRWVANSDGSGLPLPDRLGRVQRISDLLTILIGTSDELSR